MLKKFEVENFEGFKDKVEFDLESKKRYAFNYSLVDKGIVKKALIYGPNGSGKSSLCQAIMDITYHIVDKEKYLMPLDRYFNGGSNQNKAKFIYTFKFGKQIVKYEYVKSTPVSLVYEKLYVDEKLVFEYNYFDESHNVNLIEEAKTLNIKNVPQQLSVIKFIYNNTILSEKSPVYKLVKYVEGMLYFKSLTEGNSYIGYSNGPESLSSIIIRQDKVKDFQNFLQGQGIKYNLCVYQNHNGVDDLGIKFDNGKILPFGSITSSGTKTIWLFYCWMLEFNHLSMLIIDEFDAYYHYTTAQAILKIVNSYENMQSIITTHNITLMNNQITRPDCCYLISDNKILPLSKLTNKEIRERNNLQNMYVNGEFSNILEKANEKI